MTKVKDYGERLEALQLALVRWQADAMAAGDKVLIIFEGRDAAGKDGTIRRLRKHLSVRNTRIYAPPKPSDRERTQWFFQRYVPHLPAGGELVIFNRSWYNRGGVERVMEFSTPEEVEAFLREAPGFEAMLVGAGVRVIKIWLDISKVEQAARLKSRKTDPLKALKRSPLDDHAQSRWDAYTEARDETLTRTHNAQAPWTIVRADEKKAARLAVMAHLVHTLASGETRKGVELPDPAVLSTFDIEALQDGRLAR